MGQDRFSSILLSLCLHLAVLVAILFWPAQRLLVAERPPQLAVSGFVTLGKAGKHVPNSKKELPAERALPPKIEATQSLPPQLNPSEAPVPESLTTPQLAPPQTALEQTPPPQQEVKSIPRQEVPDSAAVAIPADKLVQKNATAMQPPKEKASASKAPSKNATVAKQPDKTTTAKKTPKKDPQPAPKKPVQKAKTPPAKKDSLSAALGDLKKTVKETPPSQGESKAKTGKKPTGKTGSSKQTGKTSGSLSSGLDELAALVGSSSHDAEGTGPGGAGGDGVGDIGPYEQVIVSSVRPHWQLPPRADRQILSAVVYMRIGADGSILEARLATSSGNKMFDSSLISAVLRTQVLQEPPPIGEIDALVRFTPDDIPRP